MMREGRLVWHRHPRRPRTYTVENHADNRYFYSLFANDRGEWVLLYRQRPRNREEETTNIPVKLGTFRLIRDAKLAGDAHHHFQIRNSLRASQGLKDYITRYPL